ncbi:Regulatory protein RecX [Linum grandiflorum]
MRKIKVKSEGTKGCLLHNKVDCTSAVVDYEAIEEQVEFSMAKGIQISAYAQDNQLVEDANKLAIKFLAKRALTALELKKKLQNKKFPDDIVDSLVASLQHRGYVNDSLYAESFARSRWSSLSWGPMRIKQGLMKKGVSEGDAQNAIRNVFQETEGGSRESRVDLSKPSLDHLLAQASKQWSRSQDVPIEKRKSRMIRWLQYRGFDWSVISTVLGKLESGKPP